MLEDFPPIAPEPLYARLAQAPADTLVLCASMRIAKAQQAALGRWQQARGVRVWRAPQLVTPEIFLADLDLQQRQTRRLAGQPGATPLAALEVEALWQQVVAEDEHGQDLLRKGEAARKALEAWRLCHDFALSLPLPVAGDSSETAHFNRWAQRYQARCAHIGAIDPGDHRAQLIAALERGEGRVPPQVVWVGFEAPLPWQQTLQAALRARGCEQSCLLLPARAGQFSVVKARTAEHELRAAAHWVLAQAQRDPQRRIAVVIPDLGARRSDVLRVFDQVLCPAQWQVARAPQARPYNVSLGQPLAEVGLVRTALLLLRLMISGLDWGAASALLCAPYWAAQRARDAAAAADVQMRAHGALRVTLGRLRQASAEAAWRQTLDGLVEASSERGMTGAGLWAERFSRWLQAAGWPGARALDSEEYQAQQAWHELLRDLGRLDTVLGKLSARDALAQLTELAQRRVFQPQSPEVAIQVLGALEAQGLQFDALWVAGLQDEVWPPAANPNPLIPYDVQRQAGLPHASAAVDLAWAQRLTQGWRDGADEGVLSWPETEGDRELQPSPLLRVVAAEVPRCQVPSHAPGWIGLAQSGEDVWLDDAVMPLQQTQLNGGTGLLADQATCPFRAVVHHRLQARALDVPQYGPSHLDRGNVVHAVLERLWRQWRDQATLCGLSAEARAAQVEAQLDEVLAQMARAAPERLTPAMQALERARLSQQIGEWLAIEAQRPPFVVEVLEGQAVEGEARAPTVDFDGISLRLRPDRIDRLESGARVVLDYKTGGELKTQWLDPRPEAPQLPLYALTEAEVAGVAYAQINVKNIGLVGIGDSAELAQGIRDVHQTQAFKALQMGWFEVLDHWRDAQRALVQEIRQGVASITPKNPAVSCRHCDLHAVCRIREHTFLSDDDESSSGDVA